MSDYVIRKKNKNTKIVKVIYQEKVSNKQEDNIEMSFKNLLKLVNYYLNDDNDTSSTVGIILDEVARLKHIIIGNERLLKKEQDEYLTKLKLVENKVKYKAIKQEKEVNHCR